MRNRSLLLTVCLIASAFAVVLGVFFLLKAAPNGKIPDIGETAGIAGIDTGGGDSQPIEDENGLVSGTVRADDGTVPDARVKWFAAASPGGNGIAVTDKNGAFSVRARRGAVLLLIAEAGGRKAVVKTCAPAEVGLYLAAPASIAGHVVDAHTKEPVRRFTVVLFPRNFPEAGCGYVPAIGERIQNLFFPAEGRGVLSRTIASESGEFLLEGIPPAPYDVIVLSSGYYRATLPALVLDAAEREAGMFFALEEAGEIRGTVVDSTTGAAVAGARVTPVHTASGSVPAAYYDEDSAAVTGPEGGFRLADPGGGSPYVRIQRDGYPETFVHRRFFQFIIPDAEDWSASWEIKLSKGARVEGIVCGPEGDFIPGAGVALIPIRPVNLHSEPLYSAADEKGGYTFEGVCPGFYSPVLCDYFALGGLAYVEPIFVPPGGPFAYDIGLSGAGIAGEVSLDGRPVGGVVVTLKSLKYQWFAGALTAADGRYTIEGLPSGDYLIPSAGGGLPVLADPNAPLRPAGISPRGDLAVLSGGRRDRFDFELEGAIIEGSIVAPGGGALPTAGDASGGLLVLYRTGSEFVRAPVSAGGLFCLGFVEPGEYIVSGSYAGYRIGPKEIAVSAGKRVDLRLEAVPAELVRLRGRVIDSATAQPIASAIVGIAGDVSTAAFTDIDGRYSLRVPPGQHEVSASKDGYVRSGRTELDLGAGNADEVDFTIRRERYGEISGRVLDTTTGEPLAGVEMRLFHEATGRIGRGVSDEAGKYAIRAPAGKLLVTIGGEGDDSDSFEVDAPDGPAGKYWVFSGTLDIFPSAPAVEGIDFSLRPVRGADVELAGSVISPGAPGFWTVLVEGSETGFVTSAPVDDEGKYSIPVPKEPLRITLGGYAGFAREIDLTYLEGSSFSADIPVERFARRATARLRVTLKAGPESLSHEHTVRILDLETRWYIDFVLGVFQAEGVVSVPEGKLSISVLRDGREVAGETVVDADGEGAEVVIELAD